MSADPWDDPRAREWAADVEANMVPAMRSSGAVLPIWTGEIDAKLAVELGASVLMDKPLIVIVKAGASMPDKPLIVIVKAGASMPDKLVRIADRIIETTVAYDPTLVGRITATLHELLGDPHG